MIIGMNHITLAVLDIERSFVFYRDLLGLKPLAKWDSQKLNLGNLISEPERVAGGLLHRMYRIITTNGQYAIKKLNPSIKTKKNIKRKNQYT